MFLDVPRSTICNFIYRWNEPCGTKGGVEPRVGGMGGSVERYFTFNMGVSNWGYLFKLDCGIIIGRASGSESGNVKTESERYAKWSVVFLYESSTSLHRLYM